MVPLCDEVTYVLLLENNKYYIGKTKQLNNRLQHHFDGTGAKWTQLHPPVKVLRIFAGDCEKKWSHYAYKKYGKQNCRGYGYTATT